jgi:acetylglutamate kinase
MKKLTIQKIGGKVIDNPSELALVLSQFSKIKGPKILIHGGGIQATLIADKLGIPFEIIEGRRVTNKATLDIATMVYAGLINKQIVSQLQKYNLNSLGLSGADLNSIKAKKRAIKTHDFGFVGDIETVNSKVIRQLLKQRITPIFCAITHDQNGQLLNTNADTIASNIAIAMSAAYKVKLLFHFDKKGVLENPDDDESVIEKINTKRFKKFKKEGIINNGMIPKIDNAFHALHHKVKKVIICGTDSKGTKICL